MNTHDMIHALMESNDLTRTQANKVVTLFFDQMAEALANGKPF